MNPLNAPANNNDEPDPDDIAFFTDRASRLNWRDRIHRLNTNDLSVLRNLNRQLKLLASGSRLCMRMMILVAIGALWEGTITGRTALEVIQQQDNFRVSVVVLLMSWISKSRRLRITREAIIEMCAIRFRDLIPYVLSPQRNRTIEELNDVDAREWTRFTKEQLRLLLLHLRIPLQVKVKECHYTGEEMMIISLTKIATGCTYNDLFKNKFGHNPDVGGYMLTWFIDHVFETFYNKISGDSMAMWTSPESIEIFRELIWETVRVSLTELEEYLDGVTDEIEILDIAFEVFRVFGFIDDTHIKSCRPGSGPVGDTPGAPRRVNAELIQRSFYSGYLRAHGLKFQTVLLPNGLFGSVFGASLRQNDIGVVNISGLDDYLMDLLQMIPGTQSLPALYGDDIFVQTAVILRSIPNPDDDVKAKINWRMKSVRQSIELCYGLITNLFKLMGDRKHHKLLRKGDEAKRFGYVCFILFNCYTCFNGNQVNTIFKSTPPSIDEYLPLHENIIPYDPLH